MAALRSDGNEWVYKVTIRPVREAISFEDLHDQLERTVVEFRSWNDSQTLVLPLSFKHSKLVAWIIFIIRVLQLITFVFMYWRQFILTNQKARQLQMANTHRWIIFLL